ncbi:hypothetical protein M8818_002541 [Zalaria obscura]|uniref:Uncharacterized protein n=1 Tax=Zalaria obscura TaxID=2024903 RepID=A0ACC3SG60_9PEZI
MASAVQEHLGRLAKDAIRKSAANLGIQMGTTRPPPGLPMPPRLSRDTEQASERVPAAAKPREDSTIDDLDSAMKKAAESTAIATSSPVAERTSSFSFSAEIFGENPQSSDRRPSLAHLSHFVNELIARTAQIESTGTTLRREQVLQAAVFAMIAPSAEFNPFEGVSTASRSPVEQDEPPVPEEPESTGTPSSQADRPRGMSERAWSKRPIRPDQMATNRGSSRSWMAELPVESSPAPGGRGVAELKEEEEKSDSESERKRKFSLQEYRDL